LAGWTIKTTAGLRPQDGHRRLWTDGGSDFEPGSGWEGGRAGIMQLRVDDR
jgi:hypothetical protein